MADIIPIRGVYESPNLMLQQLSEDQDIDGFVIVIRRKDNFLARAQYNMNRGQMALSSITLSQWAVDPEEWEDPKI